MIIGPNIFVSNPPCAPRKPCDFSLRWKIASDCASVCDFSRKRTTSALTTGAFATENCFDSRLRFLVLSSGKSKGGLSKGGLGPKVANWAQKGPFGAISALPPWLWGAEELVPIGPEKAPIGPEKVPICPKKARFRRKDFPPILSENLGLKPPFVSPPLDFPNLSSELETKKH